MGDVIFSNPQGAIAPTFDVESADLPAGTLMEMTGDMTVDKAAAGSRKVVGRLVKASNVAGAPGAVEGRFKSVIKAQAGATVVPGNLAKVAADAGDGTQQFEAWDRDTDKADLVVGMFLSGGDSGDEIILGVY